MTTDPKPLSDEEVERTIEVPTVLHVKSGGLYRVLCRALLESDPSVRMVVYQSCDSGTTWTRPASEFDDGRFVPVAENAALKAELEGARRDAGRYRWLRDADNWTEEGPTPCVATCESTMYGKELDAAIDAALSTDQARGE